MVTSTYVCELCGENVLYMYICMLVETFKSKIAMCFISLFVSLFYSSTHTVVVPFCTFESMVYIFIVNFVYVCFLYKYP